ncbi:MAG: hypothetical protein AAGE37_03675 [Pseudomonadota bacterium]
MTEPTDTVSKVEKVKDASGRSTNVETFRPAPDQIVLHPLTIAQQDSVWRTFDELPATPIEVTMDCPISEAGKVGPFCKAQGWPWKSPWYKAALKFVNYANPSFSFSDELAEPAEAGIKRRVIYPILLDPAARPDPDFAAGPLVEMSQLQFAKRQRSLGFPSRALRQEKGGVLTTECQVQSDYSVICRGLEFEPKENFHLFREWAASQGLRFQVAPKLKDGREASGVRFRTVMRFKIPR